MATLENFLELKVDLPDGNRATVSAVVPITDSDTFQIEPPIEDTNGASVFGFVESTDGGIAVIDNFYTGTTDTVQVNNRKGQDVTVVSISAAGKINSVPKRAS